MSIEQEEIESPKVRVKARVSKTLPPNQRIQVIPAYDIDDDLQVAHSGVVDEEGNVHFDECPTPGSQRMVMTLPGRKKQKLVDCHGNDIDARGNIINKIIPDDATLTESNVLSRL